MKAPIPVQYHFEGAAIPKVTGLPARAVHPRGGMTTDCYRYWTRVAAIGILTVHGEHRAQARLTRPSNPDIETSSRHRAGTTRAIPCRPNRQRQAAKHGRRIQRHLGGGCRRQGSSECWTSRTRRMQPGSSLARSPRRLVRDAHAGHPTVTFPHVMACGPRPRGGMDRIADELDTPGRDHRPLEDEGVTDCIRSSRLLPSMKIPQLAIP
jgi:hypothetical protein